MHLTHCSAINDSACKRRYRTAVEEVSVGDYVIPLGKARLVREGSNITLVGWGQQVNCGRLQLVGGGWHPCNMPAGLWSP